MQVRRETARPLFLHVSSSVRIAVKTRRDELIETVFGSEHSSAIAGRTNRTVDLDSRERSFGAVE